MLSSDVSLAVRRLEPDPTRRRWMAFLVGPGVVAIALMIPTAIGPIAVTDTGSHLAHTVPLFFGSGFAALYVVATCGSPLLSSDRVLAVYGAINLVVVSTLAILLVTGVISLWCVWAAVTSIVIAIHLRRLHRQYQLTAAPAH